MHLGAIMLSGKAVDMKNGVVNYMEMNNGIPPKIIFLDIPRALLLTWNKSAVDFSGVEDVKNGCFFSTKYKAQQVVMNPPHIMIFANNYPNLEFLTEDR